MRPVPTFARFPLVLLAVLSACRGPSFQEEALDSIEAEVREAVASLFDAMNNHDAQGVLSHYERSEGFTYVGVTDVRTTYESFARTIAPWYERHPEVSFQHEVVSVRALPPAAAVVTIRGSSSEGTSLAWTQVFVKDDSGRWLVAHEHEAWPGAPEGPQPHPM
jgi:uncharacterized protein (TIGR02246 family)